MIQLAMLSVKMKIGGLGYPSEFLDLFDGKDFDLYPHQEEAISKFREGNNVVVSVPTAAGKSLVAYSAIYETFKKGLRSIYIVPLKALASEKYSELSRLGKLGIRVALSIGEYDTSPSFIKNFDVIVCTSEKADSLLHHDPSVADELGLVVADEVHLLGDESRGPKLEMVISTIKYVNPAIRILALSATISNIGDVAEWLGSTTVNSDFRPVPLRSGIIYRKKITYLDGEEEKLKGEDEVISVVNSHLSRGGQTLVFVNSRKRSEDYAKRISLGMDTNLIMKNLDFFPEKGETDRYEETLRDLVQNGVSFHHAGLSGETRTRIEKGFREGLLKVLVATPTLAAGVNLPARVVVIRDLTRYSNGYSQFLPNMEIQQMLGRAGRPQYDSEGYAYLYAASKTSFDMANTYLSTDPEPVKSGMLQDSLLRFNVLGLISMGIATSTASIMDFLSSTFAGKTQEMVSENKIEGILEFLKDNEFIKNTMGIFTVTKFGKTVSDLYIDPKTAIILRDYFKEKHSDILALYTICTTPDVLNFRANRDEVEYIMEYFMDQNIIFQTEDEVHSAKTAMVLMDWINEVPINRISEKFNIGPGDIQAKVSSCDWISYSLARLSSMYKAEIRRDLENLNYRIKEGVREEIINLTMISGIGRVRARRLFSSGLKTLEDISRSTPELISLIPGFSTRLAQETIRNARRITGEIRS
ncbi:MAG: ATP-dependent DNA helicase [Candidatus Thermoplasmatota archaeon]|jgi:helicase|nr:ATP-dependent DNA helicase [Candidatus Thermoplasmatota archaeon]